MAGAIAGTALILKNYGGDEMGGVIAGTASLNLSKTDKLEIVTMTVNNECDGGCPQCYLQYDGPKGYASKEVIDAVVEGEFRHLAIVGKEPLFNTSHVIKTEELARSAGLSKKTVSMITNGKNLYMLNHPELFLFMDVSFDGGQKTYSRNGTYGKIIENINNISKVGTKFNALHTLYKENLANISDMVSVINDAEFGVVMFSPYLVTRNNGVNYASAASLDEIFQKLVNNKDFMSAKNALLNVDIFHAQQQGIDMNIVKEQLKKWGLENKTVLFDSDLSKQVVRVTYDGFIMNPKDSINPADYRQKMKLGNNLNADHEALLRMN
jgi:sulfatase maturation enzyme AslB (radical SAM superfamily)